MSARPSVSCSFSSVIESGSLWSDLGSEDFSLLILSQNTNFHWFYGSGVQGFVSHSYFAHQPLFFWLDRKNAWCTSAFWCAQSLITNTSSQFKGDWMSSKAADQITLVIKFSKFLGCIDVATPESNLTKIMSILSSCEIWKKLNFIQPQSPNKKCNLSLTALSVF